MNARPNARPNVRMDGLRARLGGLPFLPDHSGTRAATVAASGVDLLTGVRAAGSVTLAPLGVAVLSQPEAAPS